MMTKSYPLEIHQGRMTQGAPSESEDEANKRASRNVRSTWVLGDLIPVRQAASKAVCLLSLRDTILTPTGRSNFAASQSSLVALGRRRSSSPAMAFAMPAHHLLRYGSSMMGGRQSKALESKFLCFRPDGQPELCEGYLPLSCRQALHLNQM